MKTRLVYFLPHTHYVLFWYFTRTTSSIDACMGKTIFFLFNWSLFESRSYNSTWLIHVGLKKTNKCMAVASEPMAMQPAIARQNGRGVWIYNGLTCHRISDFFSSATKTLLRWLFTEAKICRRSASSAGLGPLAVTSLQTRSTLAAIR